MRRDDNGYIIVETITCFILFVFLNISILSLINIVTVQARVHYALTQAAETVSMYTYVLDVTGVADRMVNGANKAEGVEKDANTIKTNINSVIDAVNSLDTPRTIDASGTLYDNSVEIVEKTLDDPKAAFQAFLNYGLGEGMDQIFEVAVRPLVIRYLSNGAMTGEEYLKTAHVIGGKNGLDFGDFDLFDLGTTSSDDSRFLTGAGNVKIVVEYDIDYSFGALPLPFAKPYLHVTQEVMTRSWLSGKGEGYSHGK